MIPLPERSRFFLYYDARFAPQETVITMDYPTLGSGINATGIDAIEHYIIGISLEQRFLNRLPADYVSGTLSRFQPDYQKSSIISAASYSDTFWSVC